MDNESAAESSDDRDDALVGDYLLRLRKAAWYLPRERREWVLAQAGEQIAEATEAAGTQDPEVRALLGRLGNPKATVRAIDGHVPGTEARWMEFAAVTLILVGGFFGGAGFSGDVSWLLGIVLLWVSPRWRWQDKLLGTLVWPGGLLVASQLMARYVLGSLIASRVFLGAPSVTAGGRFFFSRPSSFSYILDLNLGHPALRHLAVLLVAAAPPVLVAIRLLRRARRPEPGPAHVTAPAGEPGPR